MRQQYLKRKSQSHFILIKDLLGCKYCNADKQLKWKKLCTTANERHDWLMEDINISRCSLKCGERCSDPFLAPSSPGWCIKKQNYLPWTHYFIRVFQYFFYSFWFISLIALWLEFFIEYSSTKFPSSSCESSRFIETAEIVFQNKLSSYESY